MIYDTQDISIWELKHMLQKCKLKWAEVTTEELGLLDASLDFFLALPWAGLRHVHTGSEVQVSYHNNSFQLGKNRGNKRILLPAQ